MEWLCPVCETINNNLYDSSMPENKIEYIRINKFCKTCYFKRDDDNWDTHIQMNEMIDKYLPRHNLCIPLTYELVNSIHPRKWFIKECTLSYIKHRVSFRNNLGWRNWRRKIVYRKFVKRILDKWQVHGKHSFPLHLVLEYLF